MFDVVGLTGLQLLRMSIADVRELLYKHNTARGGAESTQEQEHRQLWCKQV